MGSHDLRGLPSCLSQAKALSILVGAAMRVERASLANIRRAATGTAKHQIRRCHRFCANRRVETADAMRGIVGRLVNRKRKKPLLVAFDWVDIRGHQPLAASAALRGRSVPLCWASTQGHAYDGHRRRNPFEESLLLVLLLLLLRSMIPRSVKAIILADRGFGRASLAPSRRRHGFSYLIRIVAKMTGKLTGLAGRLLD